MKHKQTKLTYEQGREAIKFCNSYSRLPDLLGLHRFGSDERYVEHKDWCRLLGEEWSGFDNIATYRTQLRFVLAHGSRRMPDTERLMMDATELAAFDALPEKVTIYRGCGPDNIIGCSWTADRDIAMQFPFLNRYKQDEPLLVTATVRKHRIVALKNDRDESEVITFGARRVGVETMTAEMAAHAERAINARHEEDMASIRESLERAVG
jgi:hypothetical protein